MSDILDNVSNVGNLLNSTALNEVIGNATAVAATVADALNATGLTDFLSNLTDITPISDIEELLVSGGLPFLQSLVLNPEGFFGSLGLTSKESYIGPYLPNPHCLVSFADTKPNTRSKSMKIQRSSVAICKLFLHEILRGAVNLKSSSSHICATSCGRSYYYTSYESYGCPL